MCHLQVCCCQAPDGAATEEQAGCTCCKCCCCHAQNGSCSRGVRKQATNASTPGHRRVSEVNWHRQRIIYKAVPAFLNVPMFKEGMYILSVECIHGCNCWCGRRPQLLVLSMSEQSQAWIVMVPMQFCVHCQPVAC